VWGGGHILKGLWHGHIQKKKNTYLNILWPKGNFHIKKISNLSSMTFEFSLVIFTLLYQWFFSFFLLCIMLFFTNHMSFLNVLNNSWYDSKFGLKQLLIIEGDQWQCQVWLCMQWFYMDDQRSFSEMAHHMLAN
jgi:hypothetical protein